MLDPVNITNGPKLRLPNNDQIQANKKGQLPLPLDLSPLARTAHVFHKLIIASLLSISKLYDDGCVAVFDEKDLRIFKRNDLILMGHRNRDDFLWDVKLDPQQIVGYDKKIYKQEAYFTQSVNMIVWKDQTKTKLGEYLHKCAFSPFLSTFMKAI